MQVHSALVLGMLSNKNIKIHNVKREAKLPVLHFNDLYFLIYITYNLPKCKMYNYFHGVHNKDACKLSLTFIFEENKPTIP